MRLLSDLAVVAKAGHEGPLVAAKTAFLSSFIDCQEKLVEIFEKVLAFSALSKILLRFYVNFNCFSLSL